MDTTITANKPETAPERDLRTEAQKESDARITAEKALFVRMEEEKHKPMMRVVAHDESGEKDPKANAVRVARLKKIYGF